MVEMLRLDRMAEALKTAHPEVADMSVENKMAFYKKTYSNTDMVSNERAWHFTAFRMAFLDRLDGE